MNEGLIPRRYAKALYDVAASRRQAERLYDMMRGMLGISSGQPQLVHSLANPYVSDADKSMLLTIAAGATDSDTVFADWLRVLAQNRRMGMAADIARAYVAHYRTVRHIYPVTVTTATPLSEADSKRLKALIQTHIGDAATMEYAERVDPALIGGFAIDIASERLDASVRNRFEQMRLNLLKKQ